MHDSSSLDDVAGPLVHTFRLCDIACERTDLREMMDALGIAPVVFCHRKLKSCMALGSECFYIF